MNAKLKCILLIDDNEHDNLFHELVIKKVGVTENIIIKESAPEALEYLKGIKKNDCPSPDLIFLDINMPGMDGWEFLEHYKELNPQQKSEIVLIMLTSSLNPDDEIRAEGIKEVDAFHNKPLSPVIINELVGKYFP